MPDIPFHSMRQANLLYELGSFGQRHNSPFQGEALSLLFLARLKVSMLFSGHFRQHGRISDNNYSCSPAPSHQKLSIVNCHKTTNGRPQVAPTIYH
jgi:hypothetical protein